MADITSSFFFVSRTGTLQEGSRVGTAFISFHFGLFGTSSPFISAFWAFNSVFCDPLGSYFLSFWLLGTGWICEHLCTRRVSLRYRYGYRFGTGENVEKRNNSKLCTQT